MKKLLLLASIICFQSSLAQAEVVVIGHPSIATTLSASEVKNLFLGKRKTLPNGTDIETIELTSGNAAREEFHDKYSKKTQAQLNAYWARLVFTGNGKLPKEVSSSKELISMIASNPGIIGYVEESEVTPNVVILAK